MERGKHYPMVPAEDHDIVVTSQFVLEVSHQVEGISVLHGHTLVGTMYLQGRNDPTYEWPVNLYEVRKAANRMCALIGEGDDHGDGLGEGDMTAIPAIGRIGSLERITRWIWSQLKPDIPELVRLKVVRGFPGHEEGCEYAGPPSQTGMGEASLRAAA